ncbi:Dethiobiotin synthetase [Oxynema sp. CENA135]|uniref:Dethiobiotin synthetase n=1 Tax=Oxynema sp. CENA135 TaxID=984206 RepID=UPI001909E83E|nr:Dethiobiotin synthetase [Oxynema sp. CENA135]MBK4729337.1 Dethiobiotin synthetase [Oxynema sp. CENA135]
MDYETARNFLIDQGMALQTQRNPDDLLRRLQDGKAPIPGQLTSILLALKRLFEDVQGRDSLDRPLVLALYLLAIQSQQLFEQGVRSRVGWPPLLKEDLQRVAKGVESIFAGVWKN